ncbi:Protein containing aminopeptidase domain [Mesorhizobium sp. ORS 3359]|nr:Protein containing aminopeptidase domain [Mesorhizobium sp. ORS 3359]
MTYVGPAWLGSAPPAAGVGQEIYDLAERLFPICRSITGDGVRKTLDVLSGHIDLRRHEVPTGTQVFDWTIPQEWNIRSARIVAPDGRTIVDFADSTLHVVNYSVPFKGTLPLNELRQHIHTLPEQPDVIPYRTSYYAPTWGFCMAHDRLLEMTDGLYQVEIDAELKDGSLTYGEYLHRGQTEREFLLSAHICHPSLANDNCSGLALLTTLARTLSTRKTKYSYRFLFAPGTIGALTWLSRNENRIQLIDHGLVVSCVGDAGCPAYKRSRRGDAFIDRAMAHLLGDRPGAKLIDFSPYGYDERQYCSPGFNLPVGMFQRSVHGTFPEYHTSADNLGFIAPEYLEDSLAVLMDLIDLVEGDWTPLNLFPKGEPQLGRRGLYSALGGQKASGITSMSLLWVLNLADGQHSILSMAERSGLPFKELAAAARMLSEHGLLAATL